MALYAIGDLHLSLGGDKPMDVFGGRWQGYVEKLEKGFADLCAEDVTVLCGDLSWGMSMEAAREDFLFISRLPGRKVVIKGNHDYWWSTRSKVHAFFSAHGLNTLEILHNNCVTADGIAVCGSRGWLFETGEAFDDKIINRECIRLELSIAEAEKTGLEPVVFLHYPPVYGESVSPQILEVLKKHGVRRCYYGHIHAEGCRWAIDGSYEGIRFRLVSGDYLKFDPVLVETGREG